MARSCTTTCTSSALISPTSSVAGMWGTWGNAWRSPLGQYFTCEAEEVTDEDRPRSSDGTVHFHDLITMQEFAKDERGWITFHTGEQLPPIAWLGHDRTLLANGYVEAGRDDDGPAFEIQAVAWGCSPVARMRGWASQRTARGSAAKK